MKDLVDCRRGGINLSFEDWERLEYEKRNKGEEDSQEEEEEDLRGL